jgi:hypothetical protein
MNSICEMPSTNQRKDSTFQEISPKGVNYLKNIYMNSRRANIVEIIRVVEHFPRFFKDDQNEDLIAKVTKDEFIF